MHGSFWWAYMNDGPSWKNESQDYSIFSWIFSLDARKIEKIKDRDLSK